MEAKYNTGWKTTNITPRILLFLLAAFLLAACSKETALEPIGTDTCQTNPCGNPDICPDACTGTPPAETVFALTRDDLTPEGNITETEEGYLLEGTLTMETASGESVEFLDANLDVRFDEEGSLKSISGSVQIPSPKRYFEFTEPLRADIGYFSGAFLNENRDFEILLLDEHSYFVFAIAASFEMKVATNDDPDATKPLSVKPPIGGHITYIADYSDPMFFFSRGKDGGLGNDGDGGDGGDSGSEIVTGSFGYSHKGNLLYEPTQPLEEIVRFDAYRVYGGTFPFWNVFEASGLRYETKGFSGSIFLEELLESDLTYDYRMGINGELEFTLDITSFISFGFPIGAGSTAVVAEAGTDGTLLAKAFVNGWVDPDLSWWPEMIPVKPGGQLKTSGYADQTGKFEIGLSGGFEVEMPSGKQGLEGTLQADNEALTLDGQVTIDDAQWSAHAEFTKEQTRLIASPPENFASGIPEMVTKQIDDAIALTEQALEDLEAANEAYEFELSLRGLRTAMPAIIDRARDAIDDAVDDGIESGREEADKILKEHNRVLCDDNIDSKVKGLVKPYRDALDRLEEAVANSNDNAQTRAALEDALRDLAGLKRIDKSVTVKIEHGSKTFGCGSAWKLTANRTIRVTKTILSSSEVDKILEAADNVQYIAEADGIRFDAQQLVDELPVLEELENLKNNVEACVSELTEGIGDVGFEFNHATREFRHFMFINGEEKEVGAFNIFSGDQLISNARLEVGGCTATEEYAKLMGRMK
ncbi:MULTISPECIES: hypothetical protein [unclassified Robiginitalea]|uniref:hypothetical protein n=1 Tax=Robiginitalea TaxID=252306 RepID=UPI0023497C7C|nr:MULTISPECIES: hypothetical protein [unclassified Robiginitalea]MDC6354852.1 hypothetical protein [Robiginitalea sp. PM2]MDC6375118.1 hypothetical protein [Robiginitalea sp. SP8]